MATLEAIAKTIRQEDSLEQAAARARSAQVKLTGWVRAAALFGETVPMIARQTGMMKPTVRRRLRELRKAPETP
ncbi:hypothetical protein I8D64_05915 [Brachybacterium sp. MASK1Z-5]|uniref:Uncharacterized protein n=1 Tax=Brachybacterium halotolerans TaxID=2795215 RepID=A0ABS1B8V2_9MICO|nr:hypothetical protein [Brachybacterium halotolerans]MBK0330937.1 hypothetical protein [Brachybacterium halotolerans]